MKTLGILIQRHWLAGFGALIGATLGYVNGGTSIKWILIIPPGLLTALILLDILICKLTRKPLV